MRQFKTISRARWASAHFAIQAKLSQGRARVFQSAKKNNNNV
jgi:hypothetical protein